ncbi:PrgI family protein [Candidatus Gracilibacteria bacterium]|nr:PrgI family protein [Candidatus Gracilibacteria bacterium]
MRAKVPQDVQREDQILWFITLRQLVLLLIGFGISYAIFTNMKAKYDLDFVDLAMIWFPAGLSALFAFVKVKGIPIGQLITLLVEQMAFRRSKRWWIQHGGEPVFSLTTTVPSLNKEKAQKTEEKKFDRNKVKDLARFLDGEKSNFQKAKQ